MAGPAGAADPVYVVLGLVWQVQVDHVRQLVNINAPGSQVCGHQHPQRTSLEVGQGSGASSLALVAMDSRSRHPLAGESLGHAVGAVLGAGKHQHLLPVVAADQVAEQISLAIHVAGMEQVLHRGSGAVFGSGLELHGVVQQAGGKAANIAREGC